MDYGQAIKRPFTDFGKLVIGVLLDILPVVNLFVLGYSLECAKSASKKKYGLPAWTNFGNLFVQGLLAGVICFLYVLPALILTLIGALTIMKSVLSSSIMVGKDLAPAEIGRLASAFLTGGPILLIAVLLGLLAAYLIPIALMNYTMSSKFANAFDMSKVFRKAFTSKYFVSVLVVLVYSFVVFGVLSIIPTVGALLGGFIVSVTSYTIFGEVYGTLKN